MDFALAMRSISGQKAASMVRSINIALDKRIAFEQSKAPHKAHIELRAANKQMRGNATLARFFAVLGASPDIYLNTSRKDGYRTNLKTVRKVRMLAEYMAGHHGAINGVCKALFAASILGAKANLPWVSNNDAELILLQLKPENQTPELRLALVEFSALNITDAKEARNQACQFRTAFENLGVFYMGRESKTDLSVNGITALLDNPLIKALAYRWDI